MKKNVLSKLGLLVLCFGLTAGLSACGGSDASAPAEEEATTDEAATDDAAADDAATEEAPAEEEAAE